MHDTAHQGHWFVDTRTDERTLFTPPTPSPAPDVADIRCATAAFTAARVTTIDWSARRTRLARTSVQTASKSSLAASADGDTRPHPPTTQLQRQTQTHKRSSDEKQWQQQQQQQKTRNRKSAKC